MVNLPLKLRRSVECHPIVPTSLLGCGILSSVLYVATDVLGSMRYGGYSYTDQVFSELTAEGSPTRSLMVALNGIPYTVLVTAFGVGVWTSVGSRRAGRMTGALLAGYAVAGMAGCVFFPMATRGIEGTLRNTMHIPATAVMSIFILLAMGFGAGLFGSRFRYYTYGTMVLLLVFGLLTSLQGGRLADNQSTPWMGFEERVNIYATMLWIAVLAIGLLRDERFAAPREFGKRQVTPQQLQRLQR